MDQFELAGASVRHVVERWSGPEMAGRLLDFYWRLLSNPLPET